MKVSTMVFSQRIALVIGIILILFGVGGPGCHATASANEQNLYPKSYYPQPEPQHYPLTGAVCWRTKEGPWECKAGKPADQTNITIHTGGGLSFGADNFHRQKSPKGKTVHNKRSKK